MESTSPELHGQILNEGWYLTVLGPEEGELEAGTEVKPKVSILSVLIGNASKKILPCFGS